MCRCNVITIAVVIAASMVLLLDRKAVVFALNTITVTAFTTTTNNKWSYPRRISSMSSAVWSIPPSHHIPHASKQHDDVVSIKNLSATSRRSFMQHVLTTSSTVLLNTVVTTLSSFVTNTNAMAIDTSALRPATDDQPQIPFPDINALKEVEAATTLEGT